MEKNWGNVDVKLRNKAEEILKNRLLNRDDNRSTEDTHKLIHEMELQLIELELQNEELTRANKAALEDRNKYTELYDFAPIGYFTLSPTGIIVGLNLQGATMLGKDRLKIINQPFGIFVSNSDKQIFAQFLQRTVSTNLPQNCELTLSSETDLPVQVSLTGIITENSGLCNVTAVDVSQLKLLEEKLEHSRILLSETEKTGKIGGWVFDVSTLLQTWTNEIFHILEIDFSQGAPKVPEGIGFIDPEFRPMAEAGIQRAIGFGESYDQEWRVTTAKGNKRWVHSVAQAHRENGKTIRVSGSFQDITTRKLAELELRKYKDIVSSTPNGIALLSKDYRYLIVNDAYARFSGLKREQLIGTTDADYLGQEIFEKTVKENFDKCLAGETVKYQMWYTYPTIGLRFVDITYFPFWNEKNEIDGVVALTRDTTELKNAENELVESEERMRLAVTNSPIPCMIHDEDGIVLHLSSGWTHYSGYTIDDIPTLADWTERAYSGQPGLKKNYIDNLFEINETVKNGERIITTKDGSKRIWNFQTTPLGKIHGGKRVLHSMAIDITDRKQADELLLETERKFRALFEKGPIGVAYHEMIYDDSGKPVDYRFLDANTSYRELTGIDPRGMLVTEAFPGIENDPFDWIGTFGHVATTGEQVRFQTRLEPNNRWYDCVGYQFKPGHFVAAFMEITDRKQAEEAILVSEEKFRSIAEQTSDLIALSDSKGFITYASPASKDLFNISPHEMVGHHFLDFVDKGEITKAAEKFRNIVEKGEKLLNAEFKMRRKDGSFFMGELNGSLFRSGSQEGAIVNIRNITERKLAEEQINLITERLQLSTKSAGIGIWDLNLNENILIWDKRMYELYGISEQDFENTYEAWSKGVHPDDLAKAAAELQHAIEGKKDLHIQFRIVRPEGQIRFIEAHAAIKCNADGSNLRMIGVNRDITLMKESEMQLMSILENSPTGFAINSISTGEVRYVNKAFSDAYHLPLELCRNVDTFFEYVYGDQMELGQKIIDDVKSNDPERMKWEAVPVMDRQTGEISYVSAANIMLKDLDLMISSVWDVTESIENEKRLLQALEQATESDRLKSAFLANMSHEIRTPMNGILGFADLLKEPGLSGEKQQKYIGIIEKSGARMLNIINDIIDISKIEARLVEISVSETNITNQLDFIYNFFKPEAEKKGLTISLHNKLSEAESIVETDCEKLYAVLTNLVKNAIKYTKEGSIELGCDMAIEAEHAPSPLSPTLQFYVKDTGIGIAKNRQEAIFERFIQADIADTKAYQGAGLGLSISKAYVEMLGGKIWVESEEQNMKEGRKGGSTFYFTIPFSSQPAQIKNSSGIARVSAENINIRKLKVLIVEDDEFSLLLLRVSLKKFCKEITAVNSGTDAVEYCRKNRDLDLVLMDIRLPGMNGYEATRQIRQFNPNIIIIAQTAYGLAGDREAALDAGCNDYLSKPINKEMLITLFQKYFG